MRTLQAAKLKTRLPIIASLFARRPIDNALRSGSALGTLLLAIGLNSNLPPANVATGARKSMQMAGKNERAVEKRANKCRRACAHTIKDRNKQNNTVAKRRVRTARAGMMYD